MKVEPVVLEGEVVRLEPMALEHLDGLWEAGKDEALWTLIPTNVASIDDMAALFDGIPALLDTLRITMGWAWTYLVVAELVASSSGLGYMSMQAMRGLHADLIFVAILVIGFLGLVTDMIFKWIRLVALPWARQR